MEQIEENWDSFAIPVLSQERDTGQIQSDIFSTVEDSYSDRDFTTISTESVQEDIDKGKAVKHQISEFYYVTIYMYEKLLIGKRQKSRGGSTM